MADAHASRGMALYVASQVKKAAEAFERAIGPDPLLFGAHFFYAINYRDRGDFEKAVALFERATENASDY
jgi:adenylate cyclase